MAIKFQYNKTSMQDLNKQLSVRVRALPTIKNKESALRVEVKRTKDIAIALNQEYNKKIESYSEISSLWVEFDNSLLSIEDVKLSIKKIAGVNTPVLNEIIFNVKDFVIFDKPAWYLDGIEILKDIARTAIEVEVANKKMEMLEHARKKTTQKVNLYEKVQIPGFESAILKIKRFLEDEENLSKSSQKIVKNKQEQRKEVVE
ncbi:V-type ATP synthase subunit D [Bacteroidales bacterium OttesenSCG-928-K03]|nr:V-type ATP synthase subunit D [Odoribacter sp. OttesenSCG-928-L07]MDL2240482.1 V-type ATP synthase subunit D [Bacteroidales bacterium OttesenSCG-928-K22]MDL2242280.1 V-type ATP synthase subunit D [Bacteroidales bacterium OttesenSCG-928-K03]